MFIEFSRKEVFEKENFETIYNGLKYSELCLLAAYQPIRTDEDFAYSSAIGYSPIENLFIWRHWGQSANKATKTELKWLLKVIFDDSKYFALADRETYFGRSGAYYDEQIKKRNESLRAENA